MIHFFPSAQLALINTNFEVGSGIKKKFIDAFAPFVNQLFFFLFV